MRRSRTNDNESGNLLLSLTTGFYTYGCATLWTVDFQTENVFANLSYALSQPRSRDTVSLKEHCHMENTEMSW
jgi:hypothetical protein